MQTPNTLNITVGTDVILDVTLEHEGVVLNPALIDNLQANLITGLGRKTPLETSTGIDYIVVNIPWVDGRLPGCYSLEITGSINDLAWSAVGKSIIRYTSATEIGRSTVDVDGDHYDVTMEVGYYYTDSPIEDVNVTVDNGVGTPSAVPSYIHKELGIAFHNLKGNGIKSIKQTTTSTEDHGVNVVTITDDLDNATNVEIRNGGTGPQGIQGIPGESAVFDPTTGNIAVIEQTTGESITNPMSQKAVTDEFDKLIAEGVNATYTKNKIIQPSGYSDNNKNAVSNEMPFASEIGKVKISCPNNKTKAWVYSINGTTIENITKIGGVTVAITSSNPFYFTPESGILYVVRVTTPDETAAGMAALTDEDWPIVTQFYSDPKHFINENANAIAELQDITVVPQALDFAKHVPSTWYISGAGLWAVGASLSANSSYVIPIEGGEKYIVESSTNYDCNVEFLATYVPVTGATPDFAESRIGSFRGTRVLVAPANARFLYVRNANTNVAAYLPKSVVEMIPVNKAIPSNVPLYAYERNYNNLTGILYFEAKEISAQGISDSNDKMLAKLPNRGYIEVRLNRAVGGFSVWKKNGNTITLLQGYCFSQYRYIGDYTSEYYVMVQFEQNDPPMESIVSVYTYGDFGVRTSYEAPSWIKGKKVAFVGDSIVQGAQGKNIIMDKPWPVFVAEAVGSLDFVNFGIGGALVYGNEWKSVYNNAANVQDFDVVFVCAGTNDYGGKTSKANFESAYTSVIETLVANNTKVIAMTPVNRTKTVSNPPMGFSGYCDSVIDVASSLGVDVIYMHQFTNNESFNSHLVDGLHPDEMGQRMIADILLEQIKNLE